MSQYNAQPARQQGTYPPSMPQYNAQPARQLGVHPTMPQYTAQPAPQQGTYMPSPSYITQGAYGSPYYPGYMPNQLKPLEMPKFSGKAREYIRWRQRFNQCIDTRLPEEYKLARLMEAVQGGSAEELIADLLDGPGAYDTAWAELEAWFGGADRHLEQQIRELMAYPRVNSERDLEQLQKYAVKLRSVISNIQTGGTAPSAELCIIATEKIPRSMLVRYFQRHGNGNTDVNTFSTWLLEQLKTQRYANDRAGVTQQRPTPDTAKAAQAPAKARNQTFSSVKAAQSKKAQSTQTAKPATPRWPQRCRKCDGPHTMDKCNEFRSLTVYDRTKLVRLLNLCLCCFKSDHWATECEQPGCQTCQGKHNTLLHAERTVDRAPSQAASTQQPAANAATAKQTTKATISLTSAVGGDSVEHGDSVTMGTTSFMATPARLSSQAKTTTAMVVLDSCSTCSYVSQALAKRLQLQGEKQQLDVSVIGGEVVSGTYEVVTFTIHHDDDSTTTTINAYVLPKVAAQLDLVDWNVYKTTWPHLSDIEFPAQTNAKVDLLLGLDAVELHSALEERSGEHGEPIARRTPLGWVCFGPVNARQKATPHTFMTTQVTPLDDLVRRFWELEAVGMLPTAESYLTPDERKADAFTDEHIKHDGTRFEVAIPWTVTDTQPAVENNRILAENRLQTLQRSLAKKPEVRVRYANVLDDYLKKEYIRLVSDEEVRQCNGRQWFLPHFPVVRSDRTTTKVRVVFDAAARLNGTSLNDLMYTGPKLQNDLVAILIKFCLQQIAVAADVAEMFLQVAVRPADRPYLRFLWKNADEATEVYEFTRLVFGLKASPYLAGKILKQTAERFGKSFDEIITNMVNESFYVDDLLDSLQDVNTAVRGCTQLQELLERGGFRLRKWISNSPEFMSAIPEENRATSKSVKISEPADEPTSQKTLGVSWIPEEDAFAFLYQPPAAITLTKRGVLSQLSTLFDPRGQLAPFTIRARVLFQELCINGCAWDDVLPAVGLMR